MTKPRIKAPGTAVTTLQILTSFHEVMKKIRLALWQRNGSAPHLCGIYAEAVKQFINARPQQELLREYDNANAKPGKSPGDRMAARV
jgi:hypothetical protein